MVDENIEELRKKVAAHDLATRLNAEGAGKQIGTGMLSVADSETNARVAPVSLGEPIFKLPTWLTIAIAVVATVLPMVAAALPEIVWLGTVSGIVVSLAVGLGVVSVGARKKSE